MWAFQCNLDKVIIFTSFLVVLILCGVLLSQSGEKGEKGEEGEDYTQWLRAQVRRGWQQQQEEEEDVNSTQLDQAGQRLLQSD